MKPNSHFFIVQSNEKPVITIDSEVDAIYIYFKRGAKVAKTINRPAKGMIVNVDLDAKGEVIGIEMIGVAEIEIGKILEKAGVRAPNVNWKEAALAA